MATLGSELPHQIERVAGIRERYRCFAERSDPDDRVAFEPAIALMTQDLDAAQAAIASGNVLDCLRAYEALRFYHD